MTAGPTTGGLVDSALSAALAEHAQEATAASEGRLIAALVGSTFYAPAITAPGDHRLSVIALAAPDGDRVMALFTSIPALLAWRPQARPVPVRGAEAFTAAVAEGYRAVLVDPGAPQQLVVDGERLSELGSGYVPVAGDEGRLGARVAEGRPELRALAGAEPALARAVAAAVSGEPALAGGWLVESRVGGGWEPTLAVALAGTSPASLDAAGLTELAGSLRRSLEPYLPAGGLTFVVLNGAEQQVATRVSTTPAEPGT